MDWTTNPANTGQVSYNVYKGPGTCAPSQTYSKLNATPIAALTYTDPASIGSTVCYYVTAVRPDGSSESAPSVKVTVSVPLGAPGAPTATPMNIAWVVSDKDGKELAKGSTTFLVPIPSEGQ